MAGRIRDEDVALVRERADLAEIVGEHVTLRNAGGGNLKGLCPFHDEKSPVVQGHARPSGPGTASAAARAATSSPSSCASTTCRSSRRSSGWPPGPASQLRYEEGGAAPGRQPGQRSRLVEAHNAAAAFYAEQLQTPAAAPARQFLTERGFDQAAAEHFGVGYAPARLGLARHVTCAAAASRTRS